MEKTKNKHIVIISTPNLNKIGGVRYFWESILPVFAGYDEIEFKVFEKGNFSNKLFGFIFDQWNIVRYLKEVDLFFLNFSLGKRSFFREALFAKKLVKRNVDFVVFIHGWKKEFEREIDIKYRGFFISTIGKAKKIFVLSNDFKQKLLEWGYEGEIIIETTNVDSSLIKNFSIEKKMNKISNNKRIRILFLGRIIKEKGIFELVEAFKLLYKKFDQIELIIAGNGNDFERLKEMVKEIKNIKLLGYVEGNEKIDVYKKCDIFCLPSYSEGLPITVLEAMMFGMPVITTKVGGLSDFFKDPMMGYFVNVKDIEDLKEKLKLLILDRNEIIKIGRNNHEYGKGNLTSDIVANRLYEHIKDVLIKS